MTKGQTEQLQRTAFSGRKNYITGLKLCKVLELLDSPPPKKKEKYIGKDVIP